MPSPLLDLGATVRCAHGGTAVPSAPNPRVLVNGQPTATLAAPYLIAGCGFAVGGIPRPCVTAHWLTGATRAFSGGQPLLLQENRAVSAPNGTPLSVTSGQTRVIAS